MRYNIAAFLLPLWQFNIALHSHAPIIVDCISESVTLSAETQGERAGRSFKPSGSFKVKDSRKAAGLATLIVNAPCFVIVEDHNGLVEMIGNDSFPSYIQPAFAGGESATAAMKAKYPLT
jgi:hypothetical protein